MVMAPYESLRVVELANDPAGELAAAHFAHMGADVIKVEPPEGAPSRRVGPFAGDSDDDPERSLDYWYYNGSKRSVVLDLAAAADRAAFERLLDTADVLVS